MFPLQVLPNAEIAQPAYREKYQIKSTNIPFLLIHTNEAENPGEVTEYSEMVTSTASMSRMDWAQSLLFSNFVLGLHNLGLTRCLSIFLRHTEQFSYESFYLGLIGYAASHPETVIGEIYRHINALCIGVSEGKNALAVGCPDTDGILWSFEEIVCIEAIRRIDRFFEELYAWITSLFPASPVLDAVFRYQYDIIKKSGQSSAEILSDYDFYSFFQSIYLNEPKPLEKQKIRLTVPRCSCQNTFPEYARVVIWYGRNRQETDFTSHYYGIRYEKL